jgi:hypothetical protein
MVLKHKKEVEEVKKVNLQVDVFVKDGEADEVKQSAMLGNQIMGKVGTDAFECVGVYNRPGSKVSVAFDLYELGTVATKERIVAGTHDVDVPVNGLSFLLDAEKLERLTDADKALLSDTTVLALEKISKEAQAHAPWTALEDAVIAILRHGDFPKLKQEHNTETVVGDHTDGADALLTIGEQELDCDSKYWWFCEYKVCEDSRLLYRFTWQDVPESFLDEPID